MNLQIDRIYEIQNIGKGIINNLTPENLLLIRTKLSPPGLQDVISQDNELPYGNTVFIDQYLMLDSNSGAEGGTVEITNNDYATNIRPSARIGKGLGNTTTDVSLGFFPDGTLFTDSVNERGINLAGDYEANFQPRTLITKQYLLSQIAAIPPPDGSDTKLISGSNTTITGNGTIATPYQVNVPIPDGSETKILAGLNTTITGNGTIATPYLINSATSNLIVSTFKLNSWLKDRQYTLNTGLTGVTLLDVQIKLECITSNNGFTIGDTVTINSPETNDSGGLGSQGIAVQYKDNVPGTIRVLINGIVTTMSPWTADGAVSTPFTIGLESQWAIKLIITYTQ